jgi:hypothetical protein
MASKAAVGALAATDWENIDAMTDKIASNPDAAPDPVGLRRALAAA